MVDVLPGIGLDAKDIRLVANLYWNQTAAVNIGDEKTEWG